MILLVHIIFGVAVASLVENSLLAGLLAFLSHYFLDLFPHIEYPVDNLKAIHKNFKKALPELFYLIFDFSLGIFFVLVFLNKNSFVLFFALASILPDFLTVFSAVLPNRILKIHDIFHRQKIHFLRDKKISIFWRIFTQVTAIIISILILIF